MDRTRDLTSCLLLGAAANCSASSGHLYQLCVNSCIHYLSTCLLFNFNRYSSYTLILFTDIHKICYEQVYIYSNLCKYLCYPQNEGFDINCFMCILKQCLICLSLVNIFLYCTLGSYFFRALSRLWLWFWVWCCGFTCINVAHWKWSLWCQQGSEFGTSNIVGTALWIREFL